MAYAVSDTIKLDKPILLGLDASSASAVHEVGTVRTGTDGKEFTFVYMSSSDVQTYPGAPAVWVAGTTDYQVTPDCSDTAAVLVGPTGGPAGAASGFAGLFTMANTDVNACYLWIQTKGLADGVFVSSGAVVNDDLIVTLENCLDGAQFYVNSLVDVYARVVGIATTVATDGTDGIHSHASVILY